MSTKQPGPHAGCLGSPEAAIPIQPELIKECYVKNNHDSGAPVAPTEGMSPSLQEVSSLQHESPKAAKKRCKGVTRNGTACTAWAMEGGLCYFHANPDKASELGRNGGRHRKQTYEQATEHIAYSRNRSSQSGKLAPKRLLLGNSLGQ